MENAQPDIIRKLAALANHPGTPPHEAAAARVKLKALLEKHGLTEEDIYSERRMEWTWPDTPGEGMEKSELVLLLAVARMIMDDERFPIKYAKGEKAFFAYVTTGVTDRVDIIACFSYYQKILRSDRRRIKAEVAEIRRGIKETQAKIKTLNLATRELPHMMISKYNIYPDAFFERIKANIGKPRESTGGSPKEKPLSAAERRKGEKEWEARQAAARRMSEADAWQKGEGLTGDFALEG